MENVGLTRCLFFFAFETKRWISVFTFVRVVAAIVGKITNLIAAETNFVVAREIAAGAGA